MPWTAADAKGHTKKATSAKGQRQWADVANSALKRGLSEGAAIREANAVAAKRKRTRADVAAALYTKGKGNG